MTRPIAISPRTGAALLALILTGCAPSLQAPPLETADLAIHGGMVFDGTGAPAQQVDVIVENGVIVAIGPDAQTRFSATRVIDASGMVVSPGFIDPHTHADSDLQSSSTQRRANLAFAYQGVTTVVVGNDGFGKFDISSEFGLS